MSMSIGENVKRLREARGWSQEELARKIGITQAAVGKIERNEIARSKHLPALARELGVTLHQIDSEFPQDITFLGKAPQIEPKPFSEGVIPIYASAEGGNGSIIVSYEPVDYEKRPVNLAHVRDAYGFYLVGDSMLPRYEPGERALVNPHLPPRSGDYALFFKEDGNTNEFHVLVKRLVQVLPDKWIVEQFNPAKEFELDRKEWTKCHVIVGVMTR